MAITIKAIPVLKDKEARIFQETAALNSDKRGVIDFKDQLQASQEILRKAKLK